MIIMIYKEKDPKEWTKDGKKWYFRTYYKDNEGNKKQFWSKLYATKSEAEIEERTFKTKRNDFTSINFITVGNDYIKYLFKSKKESTAVSYKYAYEKNILPYFKNKYINRLDVKDISSWKSIMVKKKFKINYLNKLYGILVCIFEHGIRNFKLDKNIARITGRFEAVRSEVVTDEQKIRYISLEDFNKLISIIDDEMWFAFYNLLFYTGMRKGEVQALKWEDIEEDIIIVNKTLSCDALDKYKITSTKNYINRKIKINKTLKEVLIRYKKYMEKYKDFNKEWFVFGGAFPISRTTIDRYKHKYFSIAEVKEITIHEFRHSHVSLLINEFVKNSKEKIDTGKFFLMMSNRMGHSIQVMQKTYMHLFPTIQDEIIDLLDNL